MNTPSQTFRNVSFGLFTKIAIGFVGLVGLLLVTSTFYQQAAMARDRATFVSSDDLIEVDGSEMYIECKGEGSPTVVFESGAGAPHLNWWEVQQTIVQDVRTCVYDRQGLGWSEYTGVIPTGEFVAQTLHTLLKNAEESGPFVLVGHSLGGAYVREYATLYPDEVVGLVLIDAVHPQQYARFPAEYSAVAISEPFVLKLCRVVAPSGILRILDIGSTFTAYAEDTPIYHEDIAIFYQSHACAGAGLELASVTNLDASAALAPLGDLPLAVLTAGMPVAERPENLSAGFSVEMLQEVEQVWFGLQEELATLSTNSSWIVVEDAAHFIHHDQPQVVIATIRHILAQAKH
ncbi:MAG: alpha/beta hydrolase [Caldilineaceae bacterium]